MCSIKKGLILLFLILICKPCPYGEEGYLDSLEPFTTLVTLV